MRPLVRERLNFLSQVSLHVKIAQIEYVLAVAVLVRWGIGMDVGEDVLPALRARVDVVDVREQAVNTVEDAAHLTLGGKVDSAKPRLQMRVGGPRVQVAQGQGGVGLSLHSNLLHGVLPVGGIAALSTGQTATIDQQLPQRGICGLSCCVAASRQGWNRVQADVDACQRIDTEEIGDGHTEFSEVFLRVHQRLQGLELCGGVWPTAALREVLQLLQLLTAAWRHVVPDQMLSEGGNRLLGLVVFEAEVAQRLHRDVDVTTWWRSCCAAAGPVASPVRRGRAVGLWYALDGLLAEIVACHCEGSLGDCILVGLQVDGSEVIRKEEEDGSP
mmetsp:Transcript_104192/g.222673  ORF Transcript_104192/g.222673 Transcript_104192/m.222673 type:complete len:329 (-) Transcript_104192:487-1473(-)